jgi:CRISP-associated protein Cas1
MKRLLNTLFVTTQGTYLARQREAVLVRVNKETKLRVPIHTLGGIVCFGRVACSPALMELCAENDVSISFLSERGKFIARVQGPVSGNVLLRREQYRKADDDKVSADFARAIVIAKIANARTVLLRARRERPADLGADAIRKAAEHLADTIGRLSEPATLDSIRGCEGEAAKTYFSVFDHLITASKEDFFLRGRSRRPPLDNVNALLSFLYTLLMHDVRSGLEGVGLDPAVGFLHRDRPGRFGLALDLMEELRPFLADRLAVSLINRQQVKPSGFTRTESGGVIMDDATRKIVLVAYQNRKQEELTHPFLDEKLSIGLLPHAQALLAARFLRGDLDGYPPFVWK